MGQDERRGAGPPTPPGATATSPSARTALIARGGNRFTGNIRMWSMFCERTLLRSSRYGWLNDLGVAGGSVGTPRKTSSHGSHASAGYQLPSSRGACAGAASQLRGQRSRRRAEDGCTGHEQQRARLNSARALAGNSGTGYFGWNWVGSDQPLTAVGHVENSCVHLHAPPPPICYRHNLLPVGENPILLRMEYTSSTEYIRVFYKTPPTNVSVLA